MEDGDAQIDSRCRQLARLLAASDQRLVLAESCTAGLVAASLAQISGISDLFCGSLVTYRNATKSKWLGVPEAILARHTAVSEPVARWMAMGALVATPEADWAASVTGHLGPAAPPEQDGLVFIGIANRDFTERCLNGITVREYRLTVPERIARQREAACRVLELVIEKLGRSES